MKVSTLALFASISSVAAFAPSTSTTTAPFGVSKAALHMTEEVEVEVEVEAPAAKKGGKMVAIKEDTVEFTAGLIGGAAGFVVGGPVLGAIGAGIANYAAKNDEEIGEVVQAVSRTSIEIYNYLIKLDNKYELLESAQKSLAESIEQVKKDGNSETLEQLEKAYATTTAKINDINEEYDLVGAGITALGVVGDLVEKAVKKAGELNEEYKLTDKALESVKKAVDSAKTA